ncbi:MAG TPA: M36 family metallopeptidase [Pyrinomonadaceae bacterium]|nr:M36 family metallopeptidase [Pyrinomonadaceae bacterium]
MKKHRALFLTATTIAVFTAFLVWTSATPQRVSGESKKKASGVVGVATKRGAKTAMGLSTGVENYDIRRDESEEGRAGLDNYRQAAGAKQALAAQRLRERMRQARETLDTSGAKVKVELNAFGTAPEVVGAVDSCAACALAPASGAGNEATVRAFLRRNAALYGLDARQVAALKKVADYTNPAGNISWVEFEQELNGIPVFQGYLRAALDRDARLARTTGNLAAGLNEVALSTDAQLSPADAARAAAKTLNYKLDPSSLRVNTVERDGQATTLSSGAFARDIKIELRYFPLEPGVAKLAYSLTLWERVNAYHILVGADDGRLLWRKNITSTQNQPVAYSVYDNDSPAPLSPTNALPGTNTQAPFISRTTFNLVSELPAFDNLGWITDGAGSTPTPATTTGNNVDAGLDRDGTDGIDPAGRPTSATRSFVYTYDPAVDNPVPPAAGAPLSEYQKGAITNLFFWSNRYHDRLYELGFTEAARNFQQNNFGRGGAGGDPVHAHVQDVPGTNNANFATPPDGSPGIMQMYIWPNPNPDRDGDLDQDIILHELTHGTSNRLHANSFGLDATMSAGMGEGWSDFYARSLLSSADEDVNGIYTIGGYATYLASGSYTDNYYYGIRRFPYAVRTNVGANGKPHNPLTLADVDGAQVNLTDGAYPRGTFGSGVAFSAHNIGEIWCMALLEVRARLITRLGYTVGNQRMLQLTTDAMKLDPANPTYLQGRDALIAADQMSYGGADVSDIWAGFAARGMGKSAIIASSSSETVTEAFDVPDTVPPSINCPSPIVTAALPGQTSANVNFNVTATDNSGSVNVTSTHASGSSFPLGTTTVISTAVDPSNNSASCTFTVTVVDAATVNRALIISEYRLRGTAGALDEFVELYNNSDAPLTVTTMDQTAGGWAIVAADGIVRAVVPAGTVIPARAHYLVANNNGGSAGGYSLSNYGGTTNAAAPDLVYTLDIPDDSGVALFSTSTSANFTADFRLDAAGSNSLAPTSIYREGAGTPALGATLAEHSFVRKLASGTPRDTGDNASDFQYVDTNASSTVAGRVHGAPAPENAASPIQRNAVVKAQLVDPQCPASGTPTSACARVRTAEGANPQNAAFGTLLIRRKFKNTTDQNVRQLRFRVVDITTQGSQQGGDADLRLLSSSDLDATDSNGNPIFIEGLTLLENSPAQPGGGGFNSAVRVRLGTQIAPGNSINVQFRLGVMTNGNFRFLVNVEALP